MKHTRRLTALLLSLAMVLSLFGCTAQESDTPTETAALTETDVSPAPDLAAYTAAQTALAETQSVSMEIRSTLTTSVGGETFLESTVQTLRYSGLGTADLRIESLESAEYDDIYDVTYREVFADDVLYISVNDTFFFSGSYPEEEALLRFLSPSLPDASLYSETAYHPEDQTLTFSAPTAGEIWAIPEEAELTDATATLRLDAEFCPETMTYSATYRYGSAEITLEMEVSYDFSPVTVEMPADTSGYVVLEHADAPRLTERAMGYLYQAETLNISALESIMSQAAGAVRNQSTILNSYGTGTNLQLKLETGIYLMDYTVNQNYEMDQEELFRDGKYTVTTDNGAPVEQSGITALMVENYTDSLRGSHMIAFDYWKDAKITDLGSLYLIELTYNDTFGDAVQDNVCNVLLGDADVLNDLADRYTTDSVTGYISVDKYTGLPVAAGYAYEGTHNIMGQDYLLTFQTDQSIAAPCLGAYYAITEERLPEAEPEVKATPLFYHVTGENGQEMWLFGTIHIGDERTAYLPQEIYDALASSDALALEFYSERFDEQMENDEELSDAVSAAYYYSDGTTADHISEELYEDALLYLKAVGGYNMNSPYLKSYLWANTIDNFYTRQAYALTNDQGVESRLEEFAEARDMEIRDVESGLFQVQMMTGWSDRLQELLLEESLSTDPVESWAATMELFEMWCAGDEAALREMLSDAVDTSEFTEEELAEYEEELPYIEEYNKSMSYDRNDGMLEVAIGYLESGDVVFYAVGLAHLLNDVNGLVDTLRAAGYTVELVEYK